jgi:hypothetical protein
MAQNLNNRSARRTLGLIGAVTCLAAVGMVSVSGSAFARAGGGGGGGGHAGGGHAAGGHAGGGHMEAGRGGYGHGGYGHGGYGRGGFYRNGRYYNYGPDGVVVEDCCYAAPVYVAPPLPVVVAPFGIFVR